MKNTPFYNVKNDSRKRFNYTIATEYIIKHEKERMRENFKKIRKQDCYGCQRGGE